MCVSGQHLFFLRLLDAFFCVASILKLETRIRSQKCQHIISYLVNVCLVDIIEGSYAATQQTVLIT